MIAERGRAAADDLAAFLDRPEVASAIRSRGGLCFWHLCHLLPRLSPGQAIAAAGAVAGRLSDLSADLSESYSMLVGYDLDALARTPYLLAHVRILSTEKDAGWPGAYPAGQGPASRLLADLASRSCPVCRAAGREQVRYLLWLGQRWPERGPTGSDLRLCPRHLHDIRSGAAGASEALSVSATAAREHVLALAAGADTLTADRPCRTCRAGQDAERRQLALLQASLLDARVLRALEDAHGLCLRHAAEVTADRDAAPVIFRLRTQLKKAQWELAEDVGKQAWDRRHEPKGHEQDAWRRVPALIDGDVYLGTVARSSNPTA